MKLKKLFLFLFLLMVMGTMSLQPIVAQGGLFNDNRCYGSHGYGISNPKFGDTKITGPDGEPLKDIIVSDFSFIELQARLYDYMGWNDWEALVWRYLDFYVYKSNVDGSKGDLIFHEKAATNLFTKNANISKFRLSKGTYDLLVKYDGDPEHCCYGSAKIYVV